MKKLTLNKIDFLQPVTFSKLMLLLGYHSSVANFVTKVELDVSFSSITIPDRDDLPHTIII